MKKLLFILCLLPLSLFSEEMELIPFLKKIVSNKPKNPYEYYIKNPYYCGYWMACYDILNSLENGTTILYAEYDESLFSK